MIQTNLAVGRRHLLWRTHGEHWGFESLLRPQVETEVDWSAVVHRLFDELDPLRPVAVTGTCELGGGIERRYVAIAFCDPSLRDAHGRPIQHHMALLFEGTTPPLREDWAERVLDHYRSAYEALHGQPRELYEGWAEAHPGMAWRDHLLEVWADHAPGEFPDLSGSWIAPEPPPEAPAAAGPAPEPPGDPRPVPDTPTSAGSSVSPAESSFKRHLGNTSLIAVTVGYVLTRFLVPRALGMPPEAVLAPPYGALVAFFEAGMVGGLADWFAVTAIFKHPLGLSWIPHTNLIAKNRVAVQAQLVGLIREFVTPEIINAHLERHLKGSKMTDAIFSDQLLEPIMEALETALEHAAQQKGVGMVVKPILRSMRDTLKPEVAKILSDPIIEGHVSGSVQTLVRKLFQAGLADQVATMVNDFLDSKETSEIVRMIEGRTWNDLQFVRLNGAVVGGLFGLVIYGLTHMFGR